MSKWLIKSEPDVWSTEWHQPLQKEEPKEDYEYADDPNDKKYYW